jgi:DUF4097 and DUF4098 domain-containing protein YvlB
MRAAMALAGFILWSAGALHLQAQARTCEANQRNDRPTVAEPREQTLAQASLERVSASPNGSVIIHGADRSDVLIHACIQATAETEDEARQLASQVQITRGPGEIKPDGPRSYRDHYWSVSYEIWLPRRSNLEAATVNGSIKLEDVQGEIKVSGVNGGLQLNRLGGELSGSTVNGSIEMQLAGTKWEGQGVEVSTTNGSVRFEIPAAYSANIETSTVNGAIHCDFPISLQGKIDKHLSFQLGGGGPEIRTSTVNGSIRFSRGA